MRDDRVSRKAVMDLIAAELPHWADASATRRTLTVLWDKVRDLRDDDGTPPIRWTDMS